MVCFFILKKSTEVCIIMQINEREFDFYYGSEADQFSFYRIPKILFTDAKFSKVSVEAKVLYGLLLDRMSLSIKNGWIDDENRVYIYFKLEDAMEFMGIGKDKGVKLFAELDSEKGCGLIIKKRQGLGKPTVIYVMNFNSSSDVANQGKKRGKTFGQNVRNIEVTDIIGEENSKSSRQIRRYIRLTELIYQLLEKVDTKRIPVIAGSEVSYLNVPSQFLVNDKLDENDCGLTTKQALEIKRIFLENKFNEEVLNEILKVNEIEKEKTNFNYDRLKSYFPKEYSKSDCEKALWEILDRWFEKN